MRGLGIGIIVTTLLLMIAFAVRKDSISDEEVMKRAAELGMIMPEDHSLFTKDTETEEPQVQGAEKKQPEDFEDDDSLHKPETNVGSDPAPETNENSGDTPDAADSDIPGQSDPQDDENGNPSDRTGFYRISVKRGDVCRTVCEDLAANGVIDDAEALRKHLSEVGYASSISVGEYDIPYGGTFDEITEAFKAGPIEEDKLPM